MMASHPEQGQAAWQRPLLRLSKSTTPKPRQTKDGLTATGDTHLCQCTQLNVDFVHRKVQLVTTDRCHPGNSAVMEEVRTFSVFERKSPLTGDHN
jgi:hypothetical protein